MIKPNKLANNNFLSSLDISTDEVVHILEVAKSLKNKNLNIELKDKVLGLIFDKSSTRTRVSFQVAMSRLGGTTN
jgi:Ornithine carbamoyltransferase